MGKRREKDRQLDLFPFFYDNLFYDLYVLSPADFSTILKYTNMMPTDFFEVYSGKSSSCIQFPSHRSFWTLLEIFPICTNERRVFLIFTLKAFKNIEREKGATD